MRALRPAWPAILGVLGGLVAAETQLAFELGPWNPYDLPPTLVGGLACGFLGPSVILVLERHRVFVRCLEIGPGARLRAVFGWSLVGSAGIGIFSAFSSEHFQRHFDIPLRFFDPKVTVFATTTIVAFVALFIGLGFRRFQRLFLPRFAVSLAFAFATFRLCARILHVGFGPN